MVQSTSKKKKKRVKTGNDIIEMTPADPHDCVSSSLKIADNLTFPSQGNV